MATTQVPPLRLTATRPPSPSFRRWPDPSKSTSGLPGMFITSKVPSHHHYGYPNVHDHAHVPHNQTATEAHHGQHLGPPRHLHHVRHGAKSLPREVPRFKPRPSGQISIEMAITVWY